MSPLKKSLHLILPCHLHSLSLASVTAVLEACVAGLWHWRGSPNREPCLISILTFCVHLAPLLESSCCAKDGLLEIKRL